MKLLPGWSVDLSGSILSIFSDVRCFRIECRYKPPKSFADGLKFGFRPNSDERFEGERSLIDELVRRKLVACNISNEPSGLSPQAEYFAHLGLNAEEAQERISSSKILLLGLGGTGSVVLQHLVGAGAKRYVLVDHDVVSASNLERQFIYTRQQIGRTKVSAAGEYVVARVSAADISTAVSNVVDEQDLKAIVSQNGRIDLAIICIDQPPGLSYKIPASFLWHNAIPFLHGGVMIRSGFFGPFFDRKVSPFGPEFFPIDAGNRLPQTTMCYPPHNTMIGSAIAADVIHYLAGARDLIDFERRTIVDFHRGTSTKVQH